MVLVRGEHPIPLASILGPRITTGCIAHLLGHNDWSKDEHMTQAELTGPFLKIFFFFKLELTEKDLLPL